MPIRLLFLLMVLLLTACGASISPWKSEGADGAESEAVRAADLGVLRKLLAQSSIPPVIRLAPGTYHTRSPLRIRDVHGLRLEARGVHLILESRDENVIEIRDSDHVSIVGIHARHAEPSGPPGCLGTVIQIENSREVEIAESELDGSGIVGIAAYDSPGLLIRHNHIHHNSAYPVVYQGPSVTLIDNRFEANGNGNRIAFSRRSDQWPPTHDIGRDIRLPGLRMEGNTFVPSR